jgi:hypothetical protein
VPPLKTLADAQAYVNGLTVGVQVQPHPKLRVVKFEDGSLVATGGYRTQVTWSKEDAAQRLLNAVQLLKRGRR